MHLAAIMMLVSSLLPSSFTTGSFRPAVSSRTSADVQMKVGLIFSTSTGNTETVAGYACCSLRCAHCLPSHDHCATIDATPDIH